jgi:hypothetical protein
MRTKITTKGNSAQLCQNFGISGGVQPPPKPLPSVRHWFSRLLAVEVCGSAGSDCIILSKHVDHSLKMLLQGGKKQVKKEW